MSVTGTSDGGSGDAGARARLDAAFAAEERRGLMLASAARTAAVVAVLAWLAVANPERGAAYAWVMGTGGAFLLTGLAQLWHHRRAARLGTAPYMFVLVDSLLLAAVLLAPNPFATVRLPVAMPLRYASFMYFFVLLMQTAFSFRPRLLLWATACGIGAWTLGFVAIVHAPGILTDAPGAGMRARLAVYFAPDYVSHLKFQNEVVVFLVVGVGLALLVRPAVPAPGGRAHPGGARAPISRATSRPA